MVNLTTCDQEWNSDHEMPGLELVRSAKIRETATGSPLNTTEWSCNSAVRFLWLHLHLCFMRDTPNLSHYAERFKPTVPPNDLQVAEAGDMRSAAHVVLHCFYGDDAYRPHVVLRQTASAHLGKQTFSVKHQLTKRKRGPSSLPNAPDIFAGCLNFGLTESRTAPLCKLTSSVSLNHHGDRTRHCTAGTQSIKYKRVKERTFRRFGSSTPSYSVGNMRRPCMTQALTSSSSCCICASLILGVSSSMCEIFSPRYLQHGVCLNVTPIECLQSSHPWEYQRLLHKSNIQRCNAA